MKVAHACVPFAFLNTKGTQTIKHKAIAVQLNKVNNEKTKEKNEEEHT